MSTRRGFLAGLLAAASAPALARAMPPQRGMAHVVFENIDLSMFGPDARIPSMEIEVVGAEEWLARCRALSAPFTVDGELFEGDFKQMGPDEIVADIHRGIEALKANNPLNTLQLTRDQWFYARNGRREMKLPT